MMYPDNPPQIMIVGHSMGGAICVHISHMRLIPTLLGCVVIDVVEGTAMEALTSMQSFLRSRPTHFKSIQHAIEWRFVFLSDGRLVLVANVSLSFLLFASAFEVDKYEMWTQQKCLCLVKLSSTYIRVAADSSIFIHEKNLLLLAA